jgi:hypothetical protein
MVIGLLEFEALKMLFSAKVWCFKIADSMSLIELGNSD